MDRRRRARWQADMPALGAALVPPGFVAHGSGEAAGRTWAVFHRFLADARAESVRPDGPAGLPLSGSAQDAPSGSRSITPVVVGQGWLGLCGSLLRGDASPRSRFSSAPAGWRSTVWPTRRTASSCGRTRSAPHAACPAPVDLRHGTGAGALIAGPRAWDNRVAKAADVAGRAARSFCYRSRTGASCPKLQRGHCSSRRSRTRRRSTF